MRPFCFFFICSLSCSESEPEPKPETTPKAIPPVPVDTGDTATKGLGAGCGYLIKATSPEDNSVDAFYRADIVFEVSEEPKTATIEVSDQDGTVFAGTTLLEGQTATWSGEPLNPNTFHQASLFLDDCDPISIGFHVSTTGLPAGNVDEKVFEVDLTTGTWSEPPGIGPVIALFLPEGTLWFSPVVDNDEITMTAAFADIGEQAPCLATIPFPPAPYDDPWFEVMTDELSFEVLGQAVTLREVVLSGAFEPNGAGIDGLGLTGQLDARDLEPLLPAGTDLCASVEPIAPCQPCFDQVEACLVVTIEDLEADFLAGETLIPRTVDEIAVDPACFGY